jgi:hypothetical protein
MLSKLAVASKKIVELANLQAKWLKLANSVLQSVDNVLSPTKG